MREWRVRFERVLGMGGWAIYYRGARMWKKRTLAEALEYVQAREAREAGQW